MVGTRSRSVKMWLALGGQSHAVRALLAIAFVRSALWFVTVPGRLSAVASFALTCLSAAFAVLLLLSLIDDDLRLRRLANRMRDVARRLPSVEDAELPVAGLEALERSSQELADLVVSIEQRLLHRHPSSGLPTREPLFKRIAGSGSGLLGVIHLIDLERLHAFDEPLAEHVLLTQSQRVVRMLGDGPMIAQVDRARLAIWFGPEMPADVARTKLQAIGYALGETIAIDGREMLPEVRVSHALMAREGDDPAMLLTRATVARTGQDAAPHAQSDPADPLAAAQERYALEQDLRRAIERAELELQYQPLIDAQAGAACGAEALLRWRHPVHGLIPPTRFVPIMEEAGLAEEIGLWVINTACREASAWKRQGLPPLRVAVNISGHQLGRGDLVTLIERTLARHSLSSDMLEIELTETVATGDPGRVAHLFGQLRRLGVAIAIDDFGTGFSSFSTLRTLRFDKIKIDREFVTAVDERRDSQAICRSILALGQGLGIRVLAEGVETAGEYAWLRAQGCRYFQGYHFARPLDHLAFPAFVRDTDRVADLLAPPHSVVAERLRA
jgi:EAL domain-containing protein (putative c-di-GMP-specific phosphodiesterase class I)